MVLAFHLAPPNRRRSTVNTTHELSIPASCDVHGDKEGEWQRRLMLTDFIRHMAVNHLAQTDFPRRQGHHATSRSLLACSRTMSRMVNIVCSQTSSVPISFIDSRFALGGVLPPSLLDWWKNRARFPRPNDTRHSTCKRANPV